MPGPSKAPFALRFNLRSTLAPLAQTRVEESSGLLSTPISACANASVPCALPSASRSAELARLNLRSAVCPLGGSVGTAAAVHARPARYAQLHDEDTRPSLTPMWQRPTCWICCVCIFLVLGTATGAGAHRWLSSAVAAGTSLRPFFPRRLRRACVGMPGASSSPGSKLKMLRLHAHI